MTYAEDKANAEAKAKAKANPVPSNARLQDAKTEAIRRFSIFKYAQAPTAPSLGDFGKLAARSWPARNRTKVGSIRQLALHPKASQPIPAPANESGALWKDFRGVDFKPFDLRFA